MFGYVTINKMELKVKDFYRYRAYYCGLCKKLGEKFGITGRMTLTYEFTFLIVLLSSLYDKKSLTLRERCLVHPLKKRYIMTNEFTEYCADMNLLLSYYSLKDNWIDEKDYKSLVVSKPLERNVKKLCLKYGRQSKVIRNELGNLAECERNKSGDIDEVSGHFGKIVEEVFVYSCDIWEPNLRKMGYYLGKFIYIMDAWDDYEDDMRNGKYNVLKYAGYTENFDDTCHRILLMTIAECGRYMEILPLVKNRDILRNIIFSGVWLKWDAAKGETNGSL